jgi:hypothetical protein
MAGAIRRISVNVIAVLSRILARRRPTGWQRSRRDAEDLEGE